MSSLGRVRNATTGHVLRPQVTGGGGAYLKVHLGRGVQRSVHRLVCEAWHGAPPNPTDHADHIDHDSRNNTPGNLRWLSAALNAGRQAFRGPRGWERVCDQEAPEDHTPMTEAERAAADEHLAASGW